MGEKIFDRGDFYAFEMDNGKIRVGCISLVDSDFISLFEFNTESRSFTTNSGLVVLPKRTIIEARPAFFFQVGEQIFLISAFRPLTMMLTFLDIPGQTSSKAKTP